MPCAPCQRDEDRQVGAAQTPGGPAASFGRYVPSGDGPPRWWISFAPGWRRWFPHWYSLKPRFWTVQARPLGSVGPWSRVTWTPPSSRAEVCALLRLVLPDREVAVTGWDTQLQTAVEAHRGLVSDVIYALGCQAIGNPDIHDGIGNPDILPGRQVGAPPWALPQGGIRAPASALEEVFTWTVTVADKSNAWQSVYSAVQTQPAFCAALNAQVGKTLPDGMMVSSKSHFYVMRKASSGSLGQWTGDLQTVRRQIGC